VRRSLWAGGAWALPGDEVPIDTGLADRVAERAGLERDREAHLHEHAIEVHLPFVRRCNPDARVVPIVLAGLNVDECRELGLGLAAAVRESRARGEAVLLVASTDMSHYVTAETARRLDTLALERVLALDPAGLHATVRRHQISMCGFVPTTCVLFAALELGATRAELVRYGHSGETSGDLQRVVGYAGLVLR
jgi:AmmeMemoRadiSam system protein B